jgi:hypothetical protein
LQIYIENASVGGDTMAKVICHLFRVVPDDMPMTVMQLGAVVACGQLNKFGACEAPRAIHLTVTPAIIRLTADYLMIFAVAGHRWK